MPGTRTIRQLGLLPLLAGLSACSVSAPPCPDNSGGPHAPSAGCFTVADGALLLIEQRDGKISIPGGKSNHGESARCAAHRETWEETGLDLHIDEQLREFENGFALFRCKQHEHSGAISPPRPLEVRSAFFLPPSEFSGLNWRYPEQQQLMRQLMEETSSAQGTHP